MRQVKIKPIEEIAAMTHSSNEVCHFAPVGNRHIFPLILEQILPEDRIIWIKSNNSWDTGGVLFKIGEWVIDKQFNLKER